MYLDLEGKFIDICFHTAGNNLTFVICIVRDPFSSFLPTFLAIVDERILNLFLKLFVRSIYIVRGVYH